MSFPTAIQTFAGAHTFQGSSNVQCAVDWQKAQIHIGDQAGGFLSKSSLLSGAELGFTALSAYTDPTNHVIAGAPPIGLDAAGDLYLDIDTGMIRIDPVTYALKEIWGSWAGISPPGLPSSTVRGGMDGPILNVPLGATQFNMGSAAGGLFAFQNIAYFQKGASFDGLAYEWLGTGQKSCMGKAGTGAIYMFSGFGDPSDTTCQFDKLVFSLTGWVPGDWPTTNPGMSVTTVRTFVPTDLDAGWTKIQALGVCLDQTDGNPIVVFTGQSAASPNRYVAKVNAATGAVIWKTVIIGTAFNPGYQWSWSNVKFQRLYLVIPSQSGSPPNTVQTINTSDGSSTNYTAGLANLVIFGPQSSDDSYGAVVLSTDWTSSGAGSPTPLNASAAPFDGWALLYVAASAAPPIPPPSAGRKYLNESGPVRLS